MENQKLIDWLVPVIAICVSCVLLGHFVGEKLREDDYDRACQTECEQLGYVYDYNDSDIGCLCKLAQESFHPSKKMKTNK